MSRSRSPWPAVTPGGRPPERSQVVWQRAVELARSPDAHNRHAVALDLSRAARQSGSTLVHALALGRAVQRARPTDALTRSAVRLLARTIGWLGVPADDDEIGAARTIR